MTLNNWLCPCEISVSVAGLFLVISAGYTPMGGLKNGFHKALSASGAVFTLFLQSKTFYYTEKGFNPSFCLIRRSAERSILPTYLPKRPNRNKKVLAKFFQKQAVFGSSGQNISWTIIHQINCGFFGNTLITFSSFYDGHYTVYLQSNFLFNSRKSHGHNFQLLSAPVCPVCLLLVTLLNKKF